ncbi:NACHT domain-containing protein [Trichoderma breve]|uniref:NACHT domain-containing protein n=1 Tax=Trichoderma breve TaxID=2034170 RepID=A0A9W9EAF1_9HYPO|nr:NACHT domain-containing protein [Trichoderma breve]KAJ4863073.1 NACHT domain-containing protein [Trichoderma breve]
MENSRNFSENTVGNNAIVNQGNGNHITVNAEHEEFNKWRHTKDSGVLWIKGDPGKGKTMLLCGIIEDLEQNSDSENLSYFFCQAADYRINTAAAVVGGLIQSLLKQDPALLSRIRERHGNGPKGQLDGPNALVILCDIFETITNDPGLTNVICVVDALDECITDCRRLLNLIIKTSGRVKWLLSSRNEKDIEKGLDQVPQKLILELKQNAEQISISIDEYISHHIQEIDALKDDEQLQTKTFDMLKSKAQGTFLWVALVVDQLHNTDHWRVEDVLEEVPKDLENLYGLILDRTEKLGRKGREACQVLLSIVTTAKRPLHLEELLVFVNSHWKESKHFKATYNLRDMRDMAKDCGSILSIREDIIYFIHQSAKDYIVENATQRIFPILHQHYKMFETSLEAMFSVLKYDIYDLEDPGIHIDEISPKDNRSDPLFPIRYCCVFWVEHLVLGYQFEGFEKDKYLKDDERLHSFLKEKFLCWIESLSLMRSLEPQAEIALHKLNHLVESYHGGPSLRQLTADAYRFVENLDFKLFVPSWPLQLYFSVMNLEKDRRNCTIRKTFERRITLGSRVAFFPNSNDFISVSQDGIMKRWNTDKKSSIGDQSLSFAYASYNPQFPSRVNSMGIMESLEEMVIALSPKGDLVASWYRKTSHGLGLVRIWDTETACCRNSFEPDKVPYLHATFSPNSQLLALSFSDGVRVHNAKTGAKIKHLISLDEKKRERFISRTGKLEYAWFAPNSKVLVTMEPEYQVRLWDTHTWELLHSIKVSNYQELEYLAISPDSAILATFLGFTIKFWSIDTGEYIAEDPDYKQSMPFDLQQQSRVIQIWFAIIRQNVSQLKRDNHYFAFDSINISADSKFVASRYSYYSEVHVWDGDHGRLIHVLESKLAGYKSAFEPLIFSPDSQLLAHVSSHGFSGIQIWRVITGESVCLLECPDIVLSTSVAFSSDGKYLVVGNFNGEIYIWSIYSGILVHKYALHDGSLEQNGIISPSISSDSAYVAAFWNPGRLQARIWHLHTAKISFSSDSAILACITKSMAQIFDVATGACLQSFAFDGNEHLRLLSFDPLSGQILTTKSVFYKTSSWKHWQTSPRLGYSYDYRSDSPWPERGSWILLNGKKNCFVPMAYRPGPSEWPKSTADVAMTDSLLVTVTSTNVVFIKLPTLREDTTTSVGTSEVDLAPLLIAGSTGNSFSVAHALKTSDSALRNLKRRRSTPSEASVGEQGNNLSKRKEIAIARE